MKEWFEYILPAIGSAIGFFLLAISHPKDHCEAINTLNEIVKKESEELKKELEGLS